MPEITKHAILIGINEVPHLEYLDTPSYYAIQMQNWAKTQGYVTKLFVDQPNGEDTGICSRIEILKTIRSIIEDGTDQLLIYFSGHGVEYTAGNDIWLLPNYQDDPNDCISIFLNKALAYTSGIPHVVFISDACRVSSNIHALRAASGGGILPNLDDLNPETEVDVLYSTWPGQPAVDIRNEDGTYRSIYSDRLLDCLNGHVPEVINQIQNLTPSFPAVISDDLGRYLKRIVPLETSAAGVKRQFPMNDITSRDPLHLSKFPIENSQIEIVATETSPSLVPSDTIHRIETVSHRLEELALMRGEDLDTKITRVTHRLRQDHDFFTSPDIFHRNLTGLFVTGIFKPSVYSKASVDFDYQDKRNFSIPQIINYDERYNELENDNIFLVGNPRTNRYYPVSILKGFFTQVVFEKGTLLTINYFPTDGWRKQEAHMFASEIARRKATTITAAKNGIFLGNDEIAGFLRSYKNLDPTLGLFAAYAYFQSGNFGGVRSIYEHMSREPEPVLGDVQILTKLSTATIHINNLVDVPLPVLTQGWSYLKLLPENPYDNLSKYLEPGLWTCFNRNGLRYLIDNINYRQI